MKWLVVGVWLIGVYSVLYYIEIKTSVVEIPQTIILERNEVTDEWKTSIKDDNGIISLEFETVGVIIFANPSAIGLGLYQVPEGEEQNVNKE